MTIRDLQPKLVWEIFDEITKVPRPSKREEKIIEYLVDFAQKHSLDYQRDQIGNVVIRKAATAGYEALPTVILQSHMDMVCEKNSDTEHNFDTDPIRTKIVDGWVKAEGTTLGADCGIGMAAALALLVVKLIILKAGEIPLLEIVTDAVTGGVPLRIHKGLQLLLGVIGGGQERATRKGQSAKQKRQRQKKR